MIELFAIPFSRYRSEQGRLVSQGAIEQTASPLESMDDIAGFDSGKPYALLFARAESPIPDGPAGAAGARGAREGEKSRALSACYIAYLGNALGRCDRALLLLCDGDDEVPFPKDADVLVYDSSGELECVYGKPLVPASGFTGGNVAGTGRRPRYIGELPESYLEYAARREFHSASHGPKFTDLLGISGSEHVPDGLDALSLLSYGRFRTPEELLGAKRPYNALIEDLPVDANSLNRQLSGTDAGSLAWLLLDLIGLWKEIQDRTGIGFRIKAGYPGRIGEPVELDAAHVERAAARMDEALGISGIIDAHLSGVPREMLEFPDD